MKLKYKRMTTWFSPVQLKELRQQSSKKGVSRSELARRAWDYYATNGYPTSEADR